MTWSAPAAWALAILAVLPLVAHLWSRKRPAALPFPTLRFLRAASPVSRRLRQVQDWPLLLLRLAIVGVICAAAAGPTLAARWREHAWRARLHRVIVVDADISSASASAAVGDLQKDAVSSTVLGPAPLADILDEAIALADRSADYRRTELAVVWSGSRVALTATDVSGIPARVGIRLIPVADVARSSPEVAAAASIGEVAIHTDDAELRDTLQADLAALALPPSSTPIRVQWHADPGAPRGPSAAECRGARAPVLRALDEMAADVRLQEAADRSLIATPSAADVPGDATAKVLARSATGGVLLRGWADAGCLVLDLRAEPRSPLTWWSLVSAREALARLDRLAATDRWGAADVARASRDGLAPAEAALPGGLDTRAAWSVALVLLLAEQAWRRRGPASRERDASAPVRADLQEPGDAA